MTGKAPFNTQVCGARFENVDVGMGKVAAKTNEPPLLQSCNILRISQDHTVSKKNLFPMSFLKITIFVA